MEVTAEIRSWKEHSIVWGSYFTVRSGMTQRNVGLTVVLSTPAG